MQILISEVVHRTLVSAMTRTEIRIQAVTAGRARTKEGHSNRIQWFVNAFELLEFGMAMHCTTFRNVGMELRELGGLLDILVEILARQ